MTKHARGPKKYGANIRRTADPTQGRDTARSPASETGKIWVGKSAPADARLGVHSENRCVADGGQPDDARAGPRGYDSQGTRIIPENAAGVSTDPATRAYIHVLRALGLQQQEIGDRLDMSRKAVQRALSATAERVRNGEDPLDVYADVLAPVLTVDPPAEGGAGSEPREDA